MFPSRGSLWALLLIFLVPLSIFSRTCSNLTRTLTTSLAKYVARNFELAPDVTVLDGGLVQNTCFRQLIFRAAAPKRILVLYLSPDRRFLSHDLLDITLDPTLERRRVGDETQAQLLSERSPARGSLNAPITIVEFADFQCPFCKQLESDLSKLGSAESKNIRLIFKNLPLAQHNWANLAANAAACVEVQDEHEFWRLHDFFFANQDHLAAAHFADKLNDYLKSNSALNVSLFNQCLAQKTAYQLVQRDIELASRFHIDSTPTLFINGQRKVGIRDSEELQTYLNQALLAVDGSN